MIKFYVNEPQEIIRIDEKTFNIDSDVNLLFLRGFKKLFDDYNNIKDDIKNKLMIDKDIILYETKTSYLKSKDSVKANKIYSAKIFCGVFKNGSRVSFDLDKLFPDEIYISLNYNNVKLLLLENEQRLNVLKSFVDFSLTFSESRVKATISHELSHWLSNCLHNNHIKNIYNLANDLGLDVRNLLKVVDFNISYIEIDAQIHGLKAIKREMVKKDKNSWNTIEFKDLFVIYPTLKAIYDSLNKESKQLKDKWQIELVKRMKRENLFGKSMGRSLYSERFITI